jgi:hypothetical protein
MKLSKMFFAGIPVLALVFTLTLAGCDNGSTSDPAPAAGNNSLTGSWVDIRATPTQAFIFTDVADPAITGAKVAYWCTTLSNENQSVTGGNSLSINNTSYTFTVNGNTLTVAGYGTAQQGGDRPSVTFNRAQGTSGSTMHGVWISDLAPDNQKYTLLIIRSSTANIFYAVGQNNWGVTAYTLSSDANATYIKWGNGNPIAYTKESDPTALNITPPGGGQQITGLLTQPTW